MELPYLPNKFTRKDFIIDSTLASLSLLVASSMFGGCEDILAQIKNRPVRRLIRNNTAANNAVAAYSQAVGLMKALPTADLRNWTKQAEIHNNHCPHGNWYFFPWHRAYLVYFERICQKLLNDPQFGLPYWDWSVDAVLPAQYRTPTTGNPLYDGTRSTAVNDGSQAMPAWAVGLLVVSPMCDESDFNLFAGGITNALRPTSGPAGSYGNIEATPHNNVHGTIQGDMGNFMSPLDAIFWNHHCMVDLCWFEWNITRQHANTSDTNWTNFDLGGLFCDENGNPVTSLPLISTVLMPLLSYQYETGIDGVSGGAGMMKKVRDNDDFKKLQEVVKKGAQTELKVKQRFPLTPRVNVNTLQPSADTIKIEGNQFESVLNNGAKDRVLLTIKNATHPTTHDVFLRVFINKPDATAETPVEDPHYAGSFYFFNHDRMACNEELKCPDYIVDLTATLNKLQKAGMLDNKAEISVNLLAVPMEKNKTSEAKFSVEGLELSISEVNVRLMNF